MRLSYRPAQPEDVEFLYNLHEAAMRGTVEAAYGAWDAAWQQARFRERFDPRTVTIILADDQPAGALTVQERAEELFVARLEILPWLQNRGIGAAVMRRVQADAAGQGKMVALQVLKANPRARAFYQRLGFRVTGEKEKHWLMGWGIRWNG
jgi:ribosomal protein S18 acetylase RimI-like enzyme